MKFGDKDFDHAFSEVLLWGNAVTVLQWLGYLFLGKENRGLVSFLWLTVSAVLVVTTIPVFTAMCVYKMQHSGINEDGTEIVLSWSLVYVFSVYYASLTLTILTTLPD